MPPIRSLLWIGPGHDLKTLGVLDSPTLDVVWCSKASALQRRGRCASGTV